MRGKAEPGSGAICGEYHLVSHLLLLAHHLLRIHLLQREWVSLGASGIRSVKQLPRPVSKDPRMLLGRSIFPVAFQETWMMLPLGKTSIKDV